LRAAREARGAPPDEEEIAPPLVRADPLAHAEAALEAARVAREEAARGGRKAIEREQRAREELDRLKARSGTSGTSSSASPAKDSSGAESPPPAPKPRRL
jgi:hypothetical protein